MNKNNKERTASKLLLLNSTVISLFWLIVNIVNIFLVESRLSLIDWVQLALLGGILFLSAVSIIILPTDNYNHLNEFLNTRAFRIFSFFVFAAGFLLFSVPTEQLLLLFGGYGNYVLRLRSFIGYLWMMGGAIGILLSIKRGGALSIATLSKNKTLRVAGLVLVAMVVSWIGVAMTGFGLGFADTLWNAPGTPVLFWQVILITLLSGVAYLVVGKFSNRIKKVDMIIFWFIWVLGALIWLYQPVIQTYYMSAPLPPNYEFYPRSDAFIHDLLSHNLLIGKGFVNQSVRIVRKPLYAFFLAGLHLLTGSDYGSVVNGQVIALAFFPALLYLMGKELHHRMTGLLLAFFVILREANAIKISGVVNAVHIKMLMVGLPSAIAIAIPAFLLVLWIKQPERRRFFPLWFGGTLGLAMLVRSQSATLIPFVLLLIFIVYVKDWRKMAMTVALFGLGGVLTVAPYLARNYIYTGVITIEHSQVSSYVAQRYTDEPLTRNWLPGESEGEAYSRFMGIINDAFIADPLGNLYNIGDNFVRNIILSLTYFPMSLKLYSPEQYVRALVFWPSWDGIVPIDSVLPMLLNLGLISIGIAALWRRFRWAGLVPLFINIGFNFSLAFARVSGWRYSLPSDWTMAVYYAAGIVQLIIWSGALLGKDLDEKQELTTEEPALFAWRGLVMPVLTLAVIGFAMPATEWLSSPKYPAISREDVIVALEESDVAEGQRDMAIELLAQPGLTVGQGEALYPIFYKAGEGVEDSKFPGEVPYPFAHLYFYLIGYDQVSIILPWEDGGLEFPHGEEVFVVGCNQNSIYWQASMVLVRSEAGDRLLFASDEGLSCP